MVSSARLTRPSMGERISVKPRLRRAISSWALVAPTMALGLGRRAVAGVRLFRADDLAGAQGFAALGFALGAVEIGTGLGDLRFEALHFGGEGAGIDLHEEIALLHHGALFEGDPVDVTGDAGADDDGLRRLEAAGHVVPFIDGTLQDLGHADRGCRPLLHGGLRLLAGIEGEKRNQTNSDIPRLLLGKYMPGSNDFGD